MTKVLTPETLRKLQLTQLDIAKEFDRICRKHDLTYQIYSGTLLGAVRHKGFIPWDDDFDVAMLRDDYDKFCKIINDEINEGYFFQTNESDPNFVHSFGRMLKRNTVLIQRTWQHVDMNHKVFIDIFPLDDVNPDSIKGKIQYHSVYLFKKMKKFKRIDFSHHKKTFKNKIRKLIQIPISPIPMTWFYKQETKINKALNGKEEYASCLTDGWQSTYLDYLVDKEKFYDVIEIEFEGYNFLAPRNYEDILKKNFGDYMKLPPKEEQVPHHGIIKLELND